MIKTKGFVAIIIFSLLASLHSIEGSETSSQKVIVPVDIYINKIYSGIVNAHIENGFMSGIAPYDIYNLLMKHVTDNVIEEIHNFASKNNSDFVTLESINLAGLNPKYSHAKLTLELLIPPSLQKAENISIMHTTSGKDLDVVKQQDLSSYINFFTYQNLYTVQNSKTDNTYTGSYTFDGSVNYINWVLYSKYTFNNYGEYEPAEITLTKDLVELNIRLRAGNYPVYNTGFQKSGKYQGFSINNNIINNSYTNTSRDIPLLISETSTAEIWMNGRPLKTITLNPGNYNLRNFPFYSGLNEIDLFISPISGSKVKYQYILPQSSSNLDQGKHDYAYSIGIPHWSPDSFLFTGTHSYGLLSFLTLGLNLQVSDVDLLVGNSIIYATNIGIFGLDNGLFQKFNDNMAYTSRIGYKYINNTNQYIPVINLSLALSSEYFYQDLTNSGKFLDVTGSLSQRITNRFNSNLALNYQTFHSDQRSDLNLLMRLNYFFKTNFSLNLTLRSSLTTPDYDESTIMLLFSYNNSKIGTSANYVSDIVSTRQRIDIKQQIPNTKLEAAATYESSSRFDDINNNINASVNYNGDRFTSRATSIFFNTVNTETYSNTVSFSTAIAYTGGYFNFSKPISDSFAIIVPRYNLEKKRVGVNFNGIDHEVKSDFLGSPILTSMSAYNVKLINIELLNPTSDIFILENEFYVIPSYRSGTVIYVGKKPEIVIRATIKDSNKNVTPYITGVIENGEEQSSFFTNSKGETIIYGLTGGRYRLHINGYKTTELDIIGNNTSSIELNIELIEFKERNNE